MEETEWDSYGTGKYEKCADCMVHCGFEATAVEDAFDHPLQALGGALGGIRTKGPMAPDLRYTCSGPPSTSSAGTSSKNSRKSVKPSVPAINFRLRIEPRRRPAHRWRFAATAGSGSGPAKSIPRSPHKQASHRISAPPGPHEAAVCARVSHDAKCREGKIMSGGDARSNVISHIRSMRSRLKMQGVLFFMSSKRGVHPGNVGDRCAAKGAGKPLRPNRIAGITRAVIGDDRACDKHRARRKTRRHPPATPKPRMADGLFATACSKAFARPVASPPPAMAWTRGPATILASVLRPVTAMIREPVTFPPAPDGGFHF